MNFQPNPVPVRFACRLCKDTLFVEVTQFIEHKKEKHLTDFQTTKCIIFEDKEDDRILSDSRPNLECVEHNPLADLATQLADPESDLWERATDTFPAAVPVPAPAPEVPEPNVSVPVPPSVPVISSSSQAQQRKVVYLFIRKKSTVPPVSKPAESEEKKSRARNPLEIHAKLNQCITKISSTLRSPSSSSTTLKAIANQQGQRRLAFPNNVVIVNPIRNRQIPPNLNPASQAIIQPEQRILDFSDLLSPETILEEPKEEAATLTNEVLIRPPKTPTIETKRNRGSGRNKIKIPTPTKSLGIEKPFKGRKVANRKLLKCPLCPREYFRTEKGLKKHEKKHDPNASDQPNGPKAFICDTCGRSCGSSWLLKIHLTKHSDLRPFKCRHPNCSQSFKTLGALQGHKRKHSDLRPFKCPYPDCNRSFKEKTSCKIHQRTIHAQERQRPFKCEKCSKSYHTSSNLKSHTRLLHGVEGESPEFKCDVCSKQFYYQSRLDRHSRIHSEDRPFKCMAEDCRAAFKTNDTLKTHVELLHNSDKKSNQCEECGRCYSRVYTLKRHIEAAHRVE